MHLVYFPGRGPRIITTYQHISTYINISQHISTYINIYQHISTYINKYQHISTHINIYQPYTMAKLVLNQLSHHIPSSPVLFRSELFDSDHPIPLHRKTSGPLVSWTPASRTPRSARRSWTLSDSARPEVSGRIRSKWLITINRG